MVAIDHLCLLIKSEDDPFYIDHLGFIVYIINTNESLEYTLTNLLIKSLCLCKYHVHSEQSVEGVGDSQG